MQPFAPASAQSPRDQYLWQLAKRRAKFQGHLLVYLVVNGGLWALYFLTARAGAAAGHWEMPWPIWSTVFWGVSLLSQGMCAYSGLSRGERTQRKYERLLAQQTSF